MILESKYNKGDNVFAAGYQSTSVARECPDCLGTRSWKCLLPSGEEHQAECPTCSHGYYPTGKISRFEVRPVVYELTIGQIRYEPDSDPDFDKGPWKYMCEETGIGCGTVHYEKDLFDTRELATESAVVKAAEVLSTINAQNEEREKKERKKLKKVSCRLCQGTGRRTKQR